jgi:arginine:ornithine antiporter/lysine permease
MDTMSNIKTTATNIKDLSFVALFSLIFGSMMGSGVFDIPQNISHGAGVAAISIGWIITTIGILSLSWAFIYITNKRPDIQSGLYGYAKHGFGDYIGFNSAWGYALNALLANASYLIYICATLGNFAIFKFFGKGNTIPALMVESLLIWVVYFLINRGIREASFINILISAIKILTLIAVIVVFFVGFHWTQFKSNLHFEVKLGGIFDQVKSTMLVTVWDFTGIEAACIFALRAKSMQDVAKATLLGAIVVCIIDAIISILPFGMMPGGAIRELATPSTAALLSSIYGAYSGDIIRITVIISVVGALLAWTMLATNMFYVAAEDKTMPKFLLKMNKKNVPVNCVLLSSLAAQLFIILAFFTNSVYLAMIQLATSLILLPYLLATLFAMKLVLETGKVDTLSFIKGLLAVLYGIWLVYSGGIMFLALSCLMYLVGAVFYFIARYEQQKTLFANKFEVGVFVLLSVVTVLSLSMISKWSSMVFT